MDDSTLKPFIEEVKSRVDLVALVGRYVQLREVGSYHVGRSLKNRDSDPSLKVKRDGSRWRDYSAGEGGDCFTFLQYATGCSFMEALKELARGVGLAMPGVSPEQAAEELKTFHARRRIEELLTEATHFYYEGMTGGLRHEYWERGFTEESIDHFQLGFGKTGLWQHFEKLGISEVERLSTGLFIKQRNGEIAEFFANRLLFPYWHSGRVVYLIGRRSSLSSDEKWDQAKYKKLLTHSDRHPYVSELVTNDYFFVAQRERADGVVLVCEGVADAVAAWQAGYDVISPVTVRFRRDDHAKLVRDTARAKRVVICNDSEESGSGERGALETASVLHAAGRDVRLATIPRPQGVAKVDVNDVVREQGPAALEAIVKMAKSLPEFLLERIPSGQPGTDVVAQLEPLVKAMRSVGPIERGLLVGKIAARLGVGKRAVQQQLDAIDRALPRDKPIDHGESRGAPSLPAIVINGRQQSDVIAEAGAMLAKANAARIEGSGGEVPSADRMPLLFVRSGQLVGLRCEREQPRLHTVTETEAYGVLLRVADWFTERQGKPGEEPTRSPTTPPHDIARDMLAFPPTGLVELDAVVSTPVFASDGALLSTPGYHPSERLWLRVDPRLGVVGVVSSPTPELRR